MVQLIGIIGAVVLAALHELARHGIARVIGLPIRGWRIGRGPLGKHVAILVAGSAAMYAGISAIAFALFTCHGLATGERWYGVDSVVQGFDAYGKLVAGDRIVAVDHDPLHIGRGETLAVRVDRTSGAPITLTVVHEGETRDLVVQPRMDTDGSAWRLGVKPNVQTDTVTDAGVASGAAIAYPIEQSIAIGRGLVRAIGPDEPDPGGPSRIVAAFPTAPEPLGVTATRLAMLYGVYLMWILIAVDLVRLVRTRVSASP